MKKTISTEGYNIFSVVSEPGDAARYDYFVYKDNDDFSFMPKGSPFRFPQRLNFHLTGHLADKKIETCSDETSKEILELSIEHSCNPHTLLECIRTAVELWEE